VTIGPQISIGTDVNFNAVVSCQLIAGAKFGFQNAKSVINFKDQSKSQSSGWTPHFEPILKASGNIELAADVGFPLGLSCGLTVKGFSKVSAGIVERLAIEAKAQFAATLKGTKEAITTTDGRQGIATPITFKNFLYAALDAFKTKKQYDLMVPFSKVLDKGCKKLSGTSSQPSRKQISNETIVDVTGDVDLSDANHTDIVLPSLATTGYNSTDGTEFISLMDSTSSLSLTACSDGNLHYQPKADNETLADYSSSTLFQSIQMNVIADGPGRILHYYINTMSKLGVFRLRVSDEEAIPIGSSYLSLNPSDEDADFKSPDTFTSFDSNGNQFLPVVCVYTNATMLPKVFVVNNVTTGLDILQSPDLEFIVTSGLIDECHYLLIIADLDGDWNVNETDEGGDSEYDSVG
jgi:hypothetical protein